MIKYSLESAVVTALFFFGCFVFLFFVFFSPTWCKTRYRYRRLVHSGFCGELKGRLEIVKNRLEKMEQLGRRKSYPPLLIGTLRYDEGKARTGTALDAGNFRGPRCVAKKHLSWQSKSKILTFSIRRLDGRNDVLDETRTAKG